MTTLPPIGSRVRYIGPNHFARNAVARVVRHRPHYPDPDNPHRVAPKSEWYLSLRLEAFPENWPYFSRDLAAKVNEVEVIRGCGS
jgi:hypothetical protein